MCGYGSTCRSPGGLRNCLSRLLGAAELYHLVSSNSICLYAFLLLCKSTEVTEFIFLFSGENHCVCLFLGCISQMVDPSIPNDKHR